eukprot:gene7618-8226_t
MSNSNNNNFHNYIVGGMPPIPVQRNLSQSPFSTGTPRTHHYNTYVCLSEESISFMPKALQKMSPHRYRYFPIHWHKFPDGTDNITIEGFSPENEIYGENVIFFASFHNNDITLSQFSVLIVLLQSFIQSLVIVLPYYPVGTNERVEVEGKVATANTYSTLFSSLPSIGRPIRLMIYDIHALQNRFYFHGSTTPSLHTAMPLLLNRIRLSNITAVVFPDEGAAKRYGKFFQQHSNLGRIVCGKVRDGHQRIVTVQDGDAEGKEVVIVDDLVQTGGTLYECAVALKNKGATKVSAFAVHAVFPNGAWRAFSRNLNGSRAQFDKFWVTNSIPITTNQLPKDDVFEVLDLIPLIEQDIDMRSTMA